MKNTNEEYGKSTKMLSKENTEKNKSPAKNIVGNPEHPVWRTWPYET